MHQPSGSIVDLARQQCAFVVHDLYRIFVAIEREGLVLAEQPASCAARLLVEADRQVERQDQVAKVDANPAVRRSGIRAARCACGISSLAAAG